MKKVIITGGAGFLGQKLAQYLLTHDVLPFDQLLLVDIIKPADTFEDARVSAIEMDLLDQEKLTTIIDKNCGILFHFAAIVSSHAESDFELGMRVNFDMTRNLLETCRQKSPAIKFIFTSSLAVFGGKLPDTIIDQTAVTPQSSYGAQKGMGELLVNDYIRKKFIDGCVIRLPTICVRPGKPNKAASSFVSSIIREPLQGNVAICPVDSSLRLWLSSPSVVITNIAYAATLSTESFGAYRTINLPGIAVTIKEMLKTLQEVGGQEAYARVNYQKNEEINKIVSSWPGCFDIETAKTMGFTVNSGFVEIIQEFISNDIAKQ